MLWSQGGFTVKALFKLDTVNHAVGHWNVFVYMPRLTEEEYISLSRGHTHATTAVFKTSGLALGWIKRLAKNYPDRSSAFNVIYWGGTWDIYFK